MASSLEFYGDGISFQVVFGKSLWFRVLPGWCMHCSAKMDASEKDSRRWLDMWCHLLTFPELFRIGGGLLVSCALPGPPVVKSLMQMVMQKRWGLTGSMVSVSVLPLTTSLRETSYSRYFLGIGTEVSFFCNFLPLFMGVGLPRRAEVSIWSSQSVYSLSHVQLFAAPWTAALQASLSITNSQSVLKLMSIKWVMPSNQLILCHPLLLLPSVFPSIRVFSNVNSSLQVAKVLELQLQHQSFQWIFRVDFP